MTTELSRRQLLQAAAASLAPWSAVALAQDALRQAAVIVGSPAGGAVDKMARLYAEAFQGRYADAVVVENKPGAGGVIAYDYVKRSGVHDGSLFFLSPAYPIVITPHLVDNLPYDPMRDFVPVAVTGRSCMTFAVGPAVPESVKTFADYLAWCKANPQQALYAAQTGSSQNLMGAVMSLDTGVKLENVSYKGDAPALTDLLGGHVPAIVLPIASALPMHRQKKVRILAVARATRSRFLPDIPTFQELGYKNVLFQDWLGIFALAGTAPDRIQRLNQAVAEVARSPRGVEQLAQIGIEPEVVTPDTFVQMVKADFERYGDFIARTHFRDVYRQASGR